MYPGQLATAKQVARLADEYRRAATHLLVTRPGKNPLSRAPSRLLAIQSIELYLNALLIFSRHDATAVRGMQHNLTKRLELAVVKGLHLRKRTAAHLQAIERNREYLNSRYGAEMTATASQSNRLSATLEEIAKKVSAILAGNAQ